MTSVADPLRSPVDAVEPAPRSAPRRWRVLRYVGGGLAAVVLIVWIGLRIEPEPLPAPALAAGAVPTVPVPDGLPEPVARFYDVLYGAEVPVLHSAVVSGRGRMRIAGISFPARFRFSHDTGEAYRHYIELTIFGRRLVTVNEWFLDGRATLELPFGVTEGPQVDQGANLALWAEAVWMPAVWVTDPRAAWEPLDASSARLSVPFGAAVETFTVDFDPDTGLLSRMESLRFKGEADDVRTRWVNEATDWGQVAGGPVPLRATVAWADERSPWADLRTEDVLYNADLDHYLTQRGP